MPSVSVFLPYTRLGAALFVRDPLTAFRIEGYVSVKWYVDVRVFLCSARIRVGEMVRSNPKLRSKLTSKDRARARTLLFHNVSVLCCVCVRV